MDVVAGGDWSSFDTVTTYWNWTCPQYVGHGHCSPCRGQTTSFYQDSPFNRLVRFDCAHVGSMTSGASNHCGHRCGIPFSKTNSIVLSRVSSIIAQHIHCNDVSPFTCSIECLSENVMEQGGNRGWIPVERQQKGGEAQGKEVKHGLFTVFVDNLPSAMDAKILFNLFTKFGIVKDVFIPAKRRIVTNSRFGFVRFDCYVAADIAIQKRNGLLVDDMVLEVKKVTYVKNIRDEQICGGIEARSSYRTGRCVWLRCHDISLNLWNMSTFNSIGSLWGSVLNLDGDICQPKVFSHTRIRVVTSCMEFINKTIVLECKVKLHPIIVCKDLLSDSSNMKHNGIEDSSSNDICGSEMKGNVLEECCKEKEEDVEVVGVKVHIPNSGMVVNTVVEETKWDEGFSRDNGACTKEVEQREGPIDCHTGEESEETLIEESVHSPESQVQVSTPGFIKSLSGSRDGLGHGINLEVDLAQALSKNLNGRGILSLNHSGLVSKYNSKSVIYRPAAAAITLSDMSEGATSLNNYLLEEVKATLQLGKSLGINFNGEEDVVLNKIIELEIQDKERANKEG
ncbi:hypothetical protein ACSBR2_007444 [Camellia fascicularis]